MRLSHRRAIAATLIAATLLPAGTFAQDRVIPLDQPTRYDSQSLPIAEPLPAPDAQSDQPSVTDVDYPEPIPIKPHYKFSCDDAAGYAPGTIDFANWSSVPLPAGTVLVFTIHPGERTITVTLDEEIPYAHGIFVSEAYRHGLKGVSCDVALAKP